MQPESGRSPLIHKPLGNSGANTHATDRSMSNTTDGSLLSSYARGTTAAPIGGSVAAAVEMASSDLTIADEPDGATDEDESDEETFLKGFVPPRHCRSVEDIQAKRTSWLSVTIVILSIYSTIMSGLWLVVSFIQPRWGHKISSLNGMPPSTATTLAALLAKTIEISFVTVFISLLGQALTRRSFVRKNADGSGVTLAEMTMRNWVIQPGSLITHIETIPSAGRTLLGAITLLSTIASLLYTTASDAMVAPKIMFGNWEQRELSAVVHASYANVQYVFGECTLLNEEDIHAEQACSSIQFSGFSYRNLLSFMAAWKEINDTGSIIGDNWSERPAATMLVFDNTSLISSWIETQHSDVAQLFLESDRIINNVTLAIPHPGVHSAATNEANGILQPGDLEGLGQYSIRAGVVSPSLNVLCVNMNAEELKPLVYTEWPHANITATGVGDQVIGHVGWADEVPKPFDEDSNECYLNRTDVDDIFRWGPEYRRRPPVFRMFPEDYNILTNASVVETDAVYMLMKKPDLHDYTLCEMRSWLSTNCSTHLTISGTSLATIRAWCEDPDDKSIYLNYFTDADVEWGPPAIDWKWLAQGWALSMDLNGGTFNNNASNARILTALVVDEPSLPEDTPSLAEALAVYASYTLVLGSIGTSFRHCWSWPETFLGDEGETETFNASIRAQQYTSGHASSWQGVFYIILILVFVINVLCLVYLLTLWSGFVTDFTEPQNLFALAVNSPPSTHLGGSCGGGPRKHDLVIPWKVAYSASANHYFFKEAEHEQQPRKDERHSEEDSIVTKSGYEAVEGEKYKRLRAKNRWRL